MISARSAMSNQQRVQIMANELTRRLWNVDKNSNPQSEYNRVCNQLTQELRSSEYNHFTARQIIVSGIRGWKKRMEVREKNGQDMYRPAHKTAKARERKKLLERETWYKEKEQESNEGEDKNSPRSNKRKSSMRGQEKRQEHPIKAVMIVPFTPGGELAKKLRENEEKLSNLTKNRIKIVERAGVKIKDLLKKSNPGKIKIADGKIAFYA